MANGFIPKSGILLPTPTPVGDFATPQTPDIIRQQIGDTGFTPKSGVPLGGQPIQPIQPIQPMQPAQTPQEIIQTGLIEPERRVVRGEEVQAPEGANFLTRALTKVGNFLFGTAPDILAREISGRFGDIRGTVPSTQQLKEEITESAQRDINILTESLESAKDRGDVERARNLENQLVNTIQTANATLGEDIFQPPTGLQTLGALATVGAAVAAPLVPARLATTPAIGTRLAVKPTGELVKRGALREVGGLGRAALETGLAGAPIAAGFVGGERLAETGDIGEAARAGAMAAPVGFAFGAAIPPIFAGISRAGRAGYTGLEKRALNPENRFSRFFLNSVIRPVKQTFKSFGKTAEEVGNISEEKITTGQRLLGDSDVEFRILDNTIKGSREIQGATELQINNAAKILTENKLQFERGKGFIDVEQLINQFPGLDDITKNVIRQTFNTTRITSQPLAEVSARFLGKKPFVKEIKGKKVKRIVRVAEEESPFFPAFQREVDADPFIVKRARQLAQTEKRFLNMADPEEAFGAALAELKKQVELGEIAVRPGKAIEARRPIGFENLNLQTLDDSLPIDTTEYLGAISRTITDQADRASTLQAWLKNRKLSSDDIKLWREEGPEALVNKLQKKALNKVAGELNITGRGAMANEAIEFMQTQLDIINNISKGGGDVPSLLRKLQATKLSFSFLPNIFQSLNTLLATDFPIVARALLRTFTKLGQERGRRAGAGAATILEAETGIGRLQREVTRGKIGKVSSVLEKFVETLLKPFKWTEININRVAAANAAEDIILQSLKNKRYDLISDIVPLETWEKALKAGKFTDDELLRGMNKFINKTQFGFNPLETPALFNTPWGSVFFQFKNFIYRQTLFVFQQTLGEIKAGRPGRAARNFAILLTMFPAGGYAITAIKKMLKGEDLDDFDQSNLSRYAEYIGNTGGLTILGDAIEAAGRKRFVEYIAGPTFSEVTQIAEAFPEVFGEVAGGDIDASMETMGRLLAARFGGLGSIIKSRLTEE